jgi:hypothetical protein
MGSDHKNHGIHYRSRLNGNEDNEDRYWTHKWGATKS